MIASESLDFKHDSDNTSMDAPEPPSVNIPLNQGLAYIIGTPTLLFTPLAYWQYDATLFGAHGLTKVFLITAIGGAVSFALYSGRRRWLLGCLLGLMAGLGAVGAHLLYTDIFQKTSMYGKESALVCWAGAAVPMLLLALILKRDQKIKPRCDSEQAAESRKADLG